MKIGIIGGWADEKALLRQFPGDLLDIAPKELINPFGLATRLTGWTQEVDAVVINNKYVAKAILNNIPEGTPVMACFGNVESLIQTVRRMIARLEREFEDAVDRAEEPRSAEPIVADLQGEDDLVSVETAAAAPAEPVVEPIAPEAKEPVVHQEPDDILTLGFRTNGRIDWTPVRDAKIGQVVRVIKPLGVTDTAFVQQVHSSRHNLKKAHGVETMVEFLKGTALLKVDGVRYSNQRAKSGIAPSIVQKLTAPPSPTPPPPEVKELPPVEKLPAAPASSSNEEEGFWRSVFVGRLNPALTLEQAAAEADKAVELFNQRYRKAS